MLATAVAAAIRKWKGFATHFAALLIVSVVFIMTVMAITSPFTSSTTGQSSPEEEIVNDPLWPLKENNNYLEETISIPLSRVMAGEPLQLDQEDKRIASYIWRRGHLEHPASEREEYNLSKPLVESPGQSPFIRKLFRNMRNGFFVEAGALDGEDLSNTLFLEHRFKWRGLLVEADPKNYGLLKAKRRKAWISNTCLAVKPHPHMVTFFKDSWALGGIASFSSSGSGSSGGKRQRGGGGNKTGSTTRPPPRKRGTTRVQCMPLYSLLAALNVSTVDYFSLDVEGSELQVLKTIPFDKVFIKTMSIEHLHSPGGKQAILEFMKTKGYLLAGEVGPPLAPMAGDIILVHQNLTKKRKKNITL